MEKKYYSVLVAVDGSDASEQALDKGIQLVKQNDSRLIIAHVIDTRAFQTISSYDEEMANQAIKMAQQTLEEYEAYALKKGVEHLEIVIKYGSPKKIIAYQLPVIYDVDLILLGATGLNVVERLLIGSVSHYIIRHAPCDVLIVRNDEKD